MSLATTRLACSRQIIEQVTNQTMSAAYTSSLNTTHQWPFKTCGRQFTWVRCARAAWTNMFAVAGGMPRLAFCSLTFCQGGQLGQAAWQDAVVFQAEALQVRQAGEHSEAVWSPAAPAQLLRGASGGCVINMRKVCMTRLRSMPHSSAGEGPCRIHTHALTSRLRRVSPDSCAGEWERQ